MHFHHLLLVFPLLLTLSSCAPPPESAPPARPKLLVLVVIDQMRGDYLARWEDLYGTGGFRRLREEGALFANCHYPFANTMTGPGHATLGTGCPPQTHGIVANEWYDPVASNEVYCCESNRYDQVPPPIAPGKKDVTKISPERLRVPTLAAVLREQQGGEARVVSLSLKDRSAVLPVGHLQDAAVYWADKYGRFVTSSYYRDRVHPWVAEFNKTRYADQWLGRSWDHLRPELDYVARSGEDDVKGESSGADQGRTFPHLLGVGPKKQMSNYYAALATSPFGNELLLELARSAIVSEKLGQHASTDFLSISFSSNDLIGHAWGPDSQEVLDVTLRTDLILRDLLNLLDEQVGKGAYTLVLSADHGICPLPEVARKKGFDARRIDPKPLLASVEEYLDTKFPTTEPKVVPAKGEKASKARWIEKSVSNMFYLDRKVLARRKVTREAVAAAIAEWLPGKQGIQQVYTRKQLEADPNTLDAVALQVQRSYHPDASGDVMLVTKPYHFIGTGLTGTTHGSPHPYDTHVPLVAFGTGIVPGEYTQRVSPEHAAVILARAAGLRPLAQARVKVPEKLFRK